MVLYKYAYYYYYERTLKRSCWPHLVCDSPPVQSLVDMTSLLWWHQFEWCLCRTRSNTPSCIVQHQQPPQLQQLPLHTVCQSKKKFEKGRHGRQCISPSSFIANAHNKLYSSLLHGKMQFFEKKNYAPSAGEGAAPPLWIRHCCLSTGLIKMANTKSLASKRWDKATQPVHHI